MSEECALGARFKMCEILLTPGKDFIIQVSQLRLVGIMGAILACRDELEYEEKRRGGSHRREVSVVKFIVT